MKYRKLRIAWSVAWGVMAVLLSMLCVRSYWWRNYVSVQIGSVGSIHCTTVAGRVWLIPYKPAGKSFWYFNNESREELLIEAKKNNRPVETRYLGFVKRGVLLPLVFFVLLSATLAATTWIHWSFRFSLRTLLIVTTLIAVVLGLVVWSVR